MWDKTQLPPTPAELALLRLQLAAMQAQQQETPLAHHHNHDERNNFLPKDKQRSELKKKSVLQLFSEGFKEGWKEEQVPNQDFNKLSHKNNSSNDTSSNSLIPEIFYPESLYPSSLYPRNIPIWLDD